MKKSEVISCKGDNGASNAASTSENQIESSLKKMRIKLLDLTARNRLINFKEQSNSIKFIDSLPLSIFERFQGDDRCESLTEIRPLLEPKKEQLVKENNRHSRPEHLQYAKNLGFDTSY
jgi:hypothetical protein